MRALNIDNEKTTSKFIGKCIFAAAMVCITLNASSCSLMSKTEPNANQPDTILNATNTNADTVSAPQTGIANDQPRYLDNKFYRDSDGNDVPDFIEVELGYDPTKDDCPLIESCGGGAAGDELNQTVNTLLMLDASGSMRAGAGSERKIDQAKASLKNFMANAPEAVETGFLVYGHKGNNTPAGKPESCAENGAELLTPIGEISSSGFDEMMARFEPTGWTPIGTALKRAREAFAGKSGQNRIIMVSDGLETCGGDPVAVARELNSENIKVVVDVVGFGVGSADQQQLRRIAEAGGGEYFDARTRADLDAYFQKQQAAYLKTMDDVGCLQQTLLDVQNCETKLSLAASKRLNEEIDRTPPSELEKTSELRTLRVKINESERARLAAYTEIRQKITERSGQARDVLDQNLRSLKKTQ